MNPIGAFLVAIAIVAIFSTDRRAATLVIIASVCYITQGVALNVGGFNFFSVRIILLAVLVRTLARGEINFHWSNSIDRSVVLYTVAVLIISTIRTGGANFAYQIGSMYDVILAYMAFRSLIRTSEDLKALLPSLAILLVPFALSMAFEAATGRDLYAIMGGVPENAWERDGKFRARGAFRSPITAGDFGSSLAPLFAGGYLAGIARRHCATGFLAATVIVMASHSSGPLMGLVFGMIALGCWQVRNRMSLVRRGMVVALICLHMIMKAPVWFLIARVGDVIGGDSYYRAYLIDRFITYFSSWWLLGTDDTADWMATQIHGGADITNQFVSSGVNGGLLSLILFVTIIVLAFKKVGRMRIELESKFKHEALLCWGLGASLLAHVVNQISVTYFDQMFVMWYFCLATTASFSAPPMIPANLSPGLSSRFVKTRSNGPRSSAILKPAEERSKLPM